ncbi:MAG: bifunctional DNA-formamidopyrimidine glycosylase/DNA-(apurinic or apyrimidinic site) lyase [Planctomycetota bacterium]|nr:bifunctional DNA-formamidopyrimidine glycosylase/DNA-(apurinic or apyrimidinic site) lyase [Planctomycetota bacterium]
MPELPEVETTVRLIRPKLVGRTVTGATVSWRRTVGDRSFEARVTGARIANVRRRAKYFVLDLERGGVSAGALVGHLRMTGRVLVESARGKAPDYGKVALALDDGHVMHFVDVRKFGRLVWRADAAAELADLGPEPLGDEFTAGWLASALRAKRRALKPLLLDQTFVAGLGNIYVDESLHRSGLHPLAKSERVKPEQAAALHREIRAVLAEAIAREGSSFDVFYRTPEGNPGSYQDQFRVYGRDGKPCRACGTTITRLVVGQRGTHVCPRCQPRPRVRRTGS